MNLINNTLHDIYAHIDNGIVCAHNLTSSLDGFIEAIYIKKIEFFDKLCDLIQVIFKRIFEVVVTVIKKIRIFVWQKCLSIPVRPLQATPIRQQQRQENTIGIEESSIKEVQFIHAQDGRLTVIQKAPQIKNLVLQGGGMKGIIYPTFLKCLDEELNFINSLVEIAGSSAGAMMALLLAFGLTPDEIEIVLNQNNVIEQLLGTNSEALELGKGIFSAGNLTNTLQHITQYAATTYFNQIQDCHDLLLNIAFLSDYDRFIERGQAGFPGGLTFKELEYLHILNPQKFKLLHVTGFQRKSKETIYFNAISHPNMPCHESVRVSMAIPLIFKTVIIDGQEVSDGGEGSNISLEVFSSRDDYKPQETVALVFHKHGKAEMILHDPLDEKGWHGPQTGDFTRTIIGKHYAENQKADAEKIHALGPNVFVMPHGDIGTLSFVADQHRIDAAKNEAAEAAIQYAIWRRHLAIHETYSNLEATQRA